MNTLWGYSIPATRSIDIDRNDMSFAAYLMSRVPSAALCIGCGSCTATCTAGGLTDFNIRKIQMLVKRGESKAAEENLHKCMLCGKCQLVCPRGVDTRHMILTMFKYLESKA